jgi:branched-chain amino acid transport system ATP-binding protein
MADTPLLELAGIETSYGLSRVLFGISLAIAPGEMVSLMGRNGMGKTTTVRSIMGLTRPAAGSIRFAGAELRELPSYRIAKLGLGLVPEGRQVFPNLTARENLLATAANRNGATDPWTLEKVYDLFPRLAVRARSMANLLSGGEQQMLAIGRALMTGPVLLALDEPSLGLAPLIIDRIYEVIVKLRDELKMTILLVEQNAQRALDIADYAYILETGRVVLDGTAEKLSANEDVREFYLGVSGAGRKSLRDVKHYKRRKRWLS